MRIFVATGIFHPESGGPATYLYRLLPVLQARGHEVCVLTFGDDMLPATDYPYPVTRIPRRTLPVRWTQYARAAWSEICRADLVFINSLGLPLLGMGRKPRVLKIVGDLAWERAVNKGWLPPSEDIDLFQTKHYDRRIALIQAQRAREVRGYVRSQDQIIVPSQYLREMVVGWGAPRERVQVIYNALSPDARTADLTPTAARAELNLAPGPLLLTVARLVSWKGIDYLLRAIKPIPDVRVLVAGDGPDEARLRTLVMSEGVADRVTFLGRVPREQMPLYFRAADYTVLYSGYEGLSHTLLESLLAGTPVIVSDKGGNPEMVRHDQNGLLVPYINVSALTETIRLAFSGDTRARLAAQTQNGLDRFTWDMLVDQTLAVLERVCTSS
ncbi:MAG: glycosyltransferase family 4 protein [Anaerolineae bacterium]|nr:glycosyltransferase family 4 protein [Anaerolineae bacterium]